MAIKIIQGQDKDLIVRLTASDSNDPFDLSTGIELIQACFVKADGTSLYARYIALTGDTASGSDLISNIADTTLIQEGDPVYGSGIPLNAYVLKTPQSVTSPTAAGVIQISANATATAVAVPLTIGEITISSPAVIGKIKISLHEDDTDLLETGEGKGFEVKVVKNGFTSYVQFLESLDILERLC